jgi:SAM-dependent methyltransferase
LCHSPKIALALPLATSAVGNDYFPTPRRQETYSLSLYLCHDCGNVQIEDIVNPDVLFRSYTYSTQSSLGLVKHFQHYAAEVARRSGAAAGALVLDIGSNDGSLLAAFKTMGYRVLGVDPATEIAERATAAGIETLPEYFTSGLAAEIAGQHGKAAIITANNVFAHSDKLPDMADGIRALLTPDGIFTFEVSYLLDIVQKMLFDTVYHEHLCYHSIRSLEAFFRRHGLELIGVERIPTKGGSLRGTVQLAGGPRPTSPAVAQLIEWEMILRLHEPESFAAFARRIDRAKEEFVSLLDRLRARGKRIAGYGASPTVTTLLNQFDLAGRIDFLVDDNPVKQNTYSPGQHIPVYLSDALYERGTDVVAVLAWNYAQPIMAKHQAFAERGGHFLVPLPLLHVA